MTTAVRTILATLVLSLVPCNAWAGLQQALIDAGVKIGFFDAQRGQIRFIGLKDASALTLTSRTNQLRADYDPTIPGIEEIVSSDWEITWTNPSVALPERFDAGLVTNSSLPVSDLRITWKRFSVSEETSRFRYGLVLRVPEPSTLWPLLIGALGASRRLRRSPRL